MSERAKRLVQRALGTAVWGTLRGSKPGRAYRRLRGWLALDDYRLRAFLRSLKSVSPNGSPDRSQRIVFATMTADPGTMTFEALLGHALVLRGASVDYLVCDLPGLPSCSQRVIIHGDLRECRGCIGRSAPLAERMGLRWHRLSDFLEVGAVVQAHRVVEGLASDELDEFVYEGYPLGQWIRVSLCFFLLNDGKDGSPTTIQTKRNLLVSGVVYVEALRKFLGTVRPTTLIALNGQHLEWRVPVELAKERGISVYCHETLGDPAGRINFDYRAVTRNATPDNPDLDGVWERWRSEQHSERELEALDQFLRDRMAPSGNAWMHATATRDPNVLFTEFGLHRDRPLAAAFSSVCWDLLAIGRDLGFDGQFAWLRWCVEYFARHPEWQLVIRGHPGEVLMPWGLETRKKATDVVREFFPILPENIRLIPPEARVDSYALLSLSRLVLVYTTTVGMEAAGLGKPVAVAGKPIYRGRGFTFDVSSADELARLIDRFMGSPSTLPEEQRTLAKKFLYLTRTHLSVPYGWIRPNGGGFRLTSAAQLQPGNNEILDQVCDAVLSHRDVPVSTAIERV